MMKDNIDEEIQQKLKEALPFMSSEKKHELLGLVEAIPVARRAFEEAAAAKAKQGEKKEAE